jgi:outer membrane lipoprotein-sorting protein
MIKKIIAGILVLAIVVLAGFKIFYKGDNVNKKLETLKENLTSYHTEATMEVSSNDEKRTFYVTVDYKKDNEDNLFRISLLDKNINQEQIMLRNKDGVYVLTPKLNQVYQFKGDYPLNSSKPYLYHSLISSFKEKETDVEKLQDGYLISYECDYENSPTWKKQDVKLSQDLKPVWVNIYDDNNNVLVEVNFSKVDLTSTYSDDFFDVSKNMETSRKEIISSSEEIELPYLPEVSVSSTLKEQTEATINGETVYILTYQGTKEFTLTQRLLEDSNEMITTSVSGEIVELPQGLGYLNNKSLLFIHNGVEYRIYSDTLSVNEMIEVLDSMDVVIEK